MLPKKISQLNMTKSIPAVFERFFANMTKMLLEKLSLIPNKQNIDSVNNLKKFFQLKQTTKDIVLKLLKNIEISKVARTDNFTEKFLRMLQSF